MDQFLTKRLPAAIVVGFLFSLYVRHDYVHWGRLGREAFIAYQMQRFDHYMAQPQPLSSIVFGVSIVAIAVFTVYELIALGLAKISNPTASQVGESHN